MEVSGTSKITAWPINNNYDVVDIYTHIHVSDSYDNKRTNYKTRSETKINRANTQNAKYFKHSINLASLLSYNEID